MLSHVGHHLWYVYCLWGKQVINQLEALLVSQYLIGFTPIFLASFGSSI